MISTVEILHAYKAAQVSTHLMQQTHKTQSHDICISVFEKHCITF
jgi:hypothetical protein